MEDKSTLSRLNIVQEALRTVPSVFLVGLSGLIGIIVFARFLDQAAIGLYSVGLSLVMFVNSLALGVGLAVKQRASDESTDSTLYLNGGLSLVIAWCLLAIGVLYASIPIIQQYTEFTTIELLALGGFVFWHCVFEIIREYISGVGYPGRAEFGAVARAVCMLALQVTLITIVPLGVTGLFIGGTAGYIIASIVLVIFGRYADVIAFTLPSKSVYRDVLGFSKWSVLDQFISTAHRRLDVVIVFIIGTAAAAGQYKIVYTAVLAAVMFANGLRKPAYVKLSNKHSKGEPIVPTAKEVSSYLSWVAIGGAFGIFVLGNKILYFVFGSIYAHEGYAVSILAVFMIFFTQRIGFEMFYYVQDRPKVSMRMNVFVVVAFLVIVGVGWIGGIVQSNPILGVATGLLLAEMCRYSVYIFLLYQETGEWFTSWRLVENCISGAVMAGVLIGLRQVVAIDEPYILAVFIGLGFGVYVCVEYFIFNRSLNEAKEIL